MKDQKTIYVDQETHKNLRILAALDGATIKEYVKYLVDKAKAKIDKK